MPNAVKEYCTTKAQQKSTGPSNCVGNSGVTCNRTNGGGRGGFISLSGPHIRLDQIDPTRLILSAQIRSYPPRSAMIRQDPPGSPRSARIRSDRQQKESGQKADGERTDERQRADWKRTENGLKLTYIGLRADRGGQIAD